MAEIDNIEGHDYYVHPGMLEQFAVQIKEELNEERAQVYCTKLTCQLTSF